MKKGDIVIGTITEVKENYLKLEIEGYKTKATLIKDEISTNKAELFLKHSRVGSKITVIVTNIKGDYIDVSKKDLPKKYRNLHKKQEKGTRIEKYIEKRKEDEKELSFGDLISEITQQPDRPFTDHQEHLIRIELLTLKMSFRKEPYDIAFELLKNNLNNNWYRLLRTWIPTDVYEQVDFLTNFYEYSKIVFENKINWLLVNELIDEESLNIFLENSSEVEFGSLKTNCI